MADDTLKETISALMDDELDNAAMQQSIRGLRNDAECRERWDQYHLIGDALRNSLPREMKPGFAASVSEAIAAENIPMQVPQETIGQSEHKPHAPVAKPWMGLAVAASVAAIAYVGVGMINVEEQGPRLAAVSPTPAPAIYASAPATTATIQTVQGQQWNVGQPAVASKLNTYLFSHRDLASGAPINAQVIPHARLVSGRLVVGNE